MPWNPAISKIVRWLYNKELKEMTSSSSLRSVADLLSDSTDVVKLLVVDILRYGQPLNKHTA